MVDDINKYAWSSHKAYLSKARKWEWVHKEYVLSLFSNNSRESVSPYRQFVSKETPEEINRILAAKKLPVIIGRQGFVDKMKELFFAYKTLEEVPQSRYLAPDTEKIMQEICRFYNVKRDSLFNSRRGFYNEPKNVSIYLARRLRGDILKEAGEIFGIDKNSSVSRVVERLKLGIKSNKNLNKRIESLLDKLLKSQE